LRVVAPAPLPPAPRVPASPPRSLAASTIIVMAATLGSSLLGFGREVVNARFFGTQREMDAFLAAATIPTILFGIFNGALVSALVPVFSEYIERGDDEGLRRLASTILNALALGLTALAALGWFAAPVFVPLVARGFSTPELRVTTEMTRWLMPTVVATSLAGVASAMLNARRRFVATALQGVAINAVTIGVVVVLERRLGIYALVLGTTLGLFAQLGVQLPAVLAGRLYRPVLDLRHPGLRRVWLMLGPIVVGSAAGQIAIFFDRNFASTLTPGYISGMNYATKLVGFPQQIFAAAIATVLFPLLASQFAKDDRDGVGEHLVLGLRLVNFITIPAVFALSILARPIVAALFQRGEFRASATDLCAGLLPYAAIGLVGLAACVVLTRCCFAAGETRWTIGISIFTVVLNVGLSLLWLRPLGARGLLLANSVSQWVQAALLAALVWRLTRGFAWLRIVDSTVRILACSTVMALALQWIATLGTDVDATFAARASYLAGQLCVGALVFVGAARLLHVEELSIAARSILRYLTSPRVPSPAETVEAPIA